MLKILRNTAFSILALSCLPACEEESTYKDFVEPALANGVDFGYIYRDMEPSNAGVVFQTEEPGEDDANTFPRHKIEIRLSSMKKGAYPLAPTFKVRDIGEDTNFSELVLKTQYKKSADKPEYSQLKVINGSVSLLDNAPGRGVWNKDGTPVDLAVELTVNRKRFSPVECKTNDNKSKNFVTVECSCVNSERETSTCEHSGSQQEASTQNLESVCCDKLGLFEEQDEPLKFEIRAHFNPSRCDSTLGSTADERFCT